MKALHLTAAVATAVALLSPAAHAGRPLATEDAGVLERGACEVESFTGRERDADALRSRVLSLQLGCGLGVRSQLALAASRTRDALETDARATLLGKTRLAGDGDGDEGGLQLALAWQLQRGARQLLGVASQPLAPGWLLHANLGHAREDGQGRTVWALALEHAATPRLDLMVETFGDDREQRPWLQAGVRWALRPQRLFLDAGWGRQPGSGARAVTLGLKAVF